VRERERERERARGEEGVRERTLNTKLGRLRLKCDGTRAETRFLLSAERTSPFKIGGGFSSFD